MSYKGYIIFADKGKPRKGLTVVPKGCSYKLSSERMAIEVIEIQALRDAKELLINVLCGQNEIEFDKIKDFLKRIEAI